MVVPFKTSTSVDVPHLDKLVHVLIYIGLTFLWLQFFIKTLVKPPFKWVVFCLILLYGIVIEIIQGKYLVFRSFDFLTWSPTLLESFGVLVVYHAKTFNGIENLTL